MRLEDIGFYTLCDERVKQVTNKSSLWRCELVLTDKCNFKCPYCKSLKTGGTLSFKQAKRVIDLWLLNDLKNIRFTGGEPTLYFNLKKLASYVKTMGLEHIAISTNGSNNIEYYKDLIDCGVNDFSISLDACCSSFGERMCGGIPNMWEKVVENIKKLSKLCYVTLGMVFTEETAHTVADVVTFGDSLGVADIRIISSAQYNKFLQSLSSISSEILERHPILKYRVKNFLSGRNVRGLRESDSGKCALVLDDSVVAGNYHFPCIIYLREGGTPIGKVSSSMRNVRVEWFKKHDSFGDDICRKNCLDVCIDYNNKYRDFHVTK